MPHDFYPVKNERQKLHKVPVWKGESIRESIRLISCRDWDKSDQYSLSSDGSLNQSISLGTWASTYTFITSHVRGYINISQKEFQ